MAFKLTKAEAKEHEEVTEAVRLAASNLEDAVRDFNEKLEALRNELLPVEQAYNSALEDARTFTERIAQRIDDDIDAKSERWQEGDKGEAAAEWRDTWQGVELEDLSLDYPEDMDDPAPGHAESLEGLPQEAAS